jgi:TldD protein
MGVRKGEVIEMSSKQTGGVGIRVLIGGAFGFASTTDLTQRGLERTLIQAEEMAKALSSKKHEKIVLAKTDRMAKGDFFLKGFKELEDMPLEQKFQVVRESEARMSKSSKQIEAASCQYSEVFEEKIICTSDGADAHLKLVRPELRFTAFASDGSKRATGHDAVGATGGWECMFINRASDQFIDNAVSNAVALLKAPAAQGGKKKVILSPAMVGLLCHEAIGHTVEADFVASGSVAQGRIGTRVASELVNMCDSGASEYTHGAGGELPVDDEGVLTEKTYIITKGNLTSYLHNRESAHQFGVKPTGNGRAWVYSDEPLIRMRNTYIEPGNDKLEDMIGGIEDGYFIDGWDGGQADATAEFMFGARRVREIKGGKLGDWVQRVTLSGQAFDVLQSVDAISTDFKWELGSGHCGKGQPAKVDAGGPYIRCEILVGGEQKS